MRLEADVIDKEFDILRRRTSSRLFSSLSISRRSRAPRSSVEEIVLAILAHSPSNQRRRDQEREVVGRSCGGMTPPVESWPVRELEQRVFGNAKGEYRKGFDGNLKNCQLMELLQYNCKVDNPDRRDSLVRCWPVERLFRR
jgi:hypothetical protein